jgi:outer membrane lipoprotein-sorting protein
MWRLAFAVVVLCTICVDLYAVNLHDKYEKEVEILENYFNNQSSFEADFIQTTNDGKVSKGKIYIQNPNNIAIDYQSGETLAKIVANKNKTTYYDKELKQKSFMDTENSAISVLLANKISAERFVIKEVNATESELFMSLSFKDAPSEGIVSISLILLPKPTIYSITITQPENQQNVKMIFTNQIVNQELPKNAFIIPKTE